MSCVKDKEPFYFRFKNQPFEQLSGEKTGSTLSLLPPFTTNRFNEQFKMTESPRLHRCEPWSGVYTVIQRWALASPASAPGGWSTTWHRACSQVSEQKMKQSKKYLPSITTQYSSLKIWATTRTSTRHQTPDWTDTRSCCCSLGNRVPDSPAPFDALTRHRGCDWLV